MFFVETRPYHYHPNWKTLFLCLQVKSHTMWFGFVNDSALHSEILPPTPRVSLDSSKASDRIAGIPESKPERTTHN